MAERTPSIETQVEHFIGYLREKKLKVTQERLALVREILATKGHFEAEDLQIRMRTQGSRVSKPTIYRTLPLLIESGLLRPSFLTGERQTYYENTLGADKHEHLICLTCGRIIEFTSDTLEEALGEVARKHSFVPQKRRIELFGLCEHCS
jgi:Fur family transcriptional regulator, ferric uptake regulator